MVTKANSRIRITLIHKSTLRHVCFFAQLPFQLETTEACINVVFIFQLHFGSISHWRDRSAKKSNSFLRVSWDDKVISSYDLPKTICICLLLDKIQTHTKLNCMRNKCTLSSLIAVLVWLFFWGKKIQVLRPYLMMLRLTKIWCDF